MFNNPLESFHNTVAEAKAEREQLDRLLTVSSPRELLLLVLVLVLLAALIVWLVFGVLDRNIATNATVLERSVSADRSNKFVGLQTHWSTELISNVKVGMPVKIDPVNGQERSVTIRGKIRSIVSSHVSEELPVAGRIPIPFIWFQITVNPDDDLLSYTDSECRLIIQLGRQSPLQLIGKNLL
ncbi:MAG: hypothetical protein F4X56_10600 [Gammaproteobacteria bacterium]|nr:hypothetical protein [Gammaproteobacteria bacterium]MYC26347.1 hypothetical protein [Gammaproteobacteria bacterium]